tara:strand:- start:809 stop:979 length:171 start_codon:yes stop_codon:yes gene_type:complete
MKNLKNTNLFRWIRYVTRKPLRPNDKYNPVEHKTTRLPESDYDGMGNFSRFGRPPK